MGIDGPDCACMADILGCEIGSFPFIHLGLPIGANMNLANNWRPVVQKFQKRMSTWKARSLSMGGRITLIKAVLSSLPTYYFSLFRAPVKVLDELERIRREFFWGRKEGMPKMSWVAWEVVKGPVDSGGIGFGSLKHTNWAMMAKWWWRFKIDGDGLWRRVVWSIHSGGKGWTSLPVRISQPGPWKQVANLEVSLAEKDIHLKKVISGVVKNGDCIMFWLDEWWGDSCLATAFPALFAKEQNKGCSIKERVDIVNDNLIFTWVWRSSSLSASELVELDSLQNYIAGLRLREEKDKWRWVLDTSGTFSVASLRSRLEWFGKEAKVDRFIWNTWVPKKVNIVGWRAYLDRLPTRQNLQNRNINLISNLCPFCSETVECLEHLLIGCHFAQSIWEVISSWSGIPSFFILELKDLWRAQDLISGSKRRKKVWHGVILVSVWSIWKARNGIVFNNEEPSINKTTEEIKIMSFLWLKTRAKLQSLDGENWRQVGVRRVD